MEKKRTHDNTREAANVIAFLELPVVALIRFMCII